MNNQTVSTSRSEYLKVYTVHEGTNRINCDVHKRIRQTVVITALHLKHADVHITVRLTGPGSNVRVIGIILGKEGSQINFFTSQIHESPGATSNLLVKSVLPAGAGFSFEGIIRIEKKAVKSDAYQRNENLLLDDSSRVRSHPSLEILANDVRCTHGAATGPLPPEQLWYLASRGISPQAARRLYIEGFLTSFLSEIRDEARRMSMWQKIHSAL